MMRVRDKPAGLLLLIRKLVCVAAADSLQMRHSTSLCLQ
jgi:hypothetical protein